MYETISENLGILIKFVVVGFFLSLFYEFFRILRALIKHTPIAIAIEEFFYLVLCGFVTYAYSLEFGTGGFRFYFILSEILGVCIYFLTIGALMTPVYSIINKIVSYIYRKFCKFILQPFCKLLYKFVGLIRRKFVNTYNFVKVHVKNAQKWLKARRSMLYNKPNVHTKIETEGKINVIKARIR